MENDEETHEGRFPVQTEHPGGVAGVPLEAQTVVDDPNGLRPDPSHSDAGLCSGFRHWALYLHAFLGANELWISSAGWHWYS